MHFDRFHPSFLKSSLTLLLAAALIVVGFAPLRSEDTTAPQVTKLTNDQLDSLVAPIALYPDTLLSQVLVASTYPLEVVQANQWLESHHDLKGQDLTDAAQAQGWDPSVQALVVFPDVLKRLSDDVTWTTRVGNAFLAQQSDVMDSVQRLRGKAEQAGKLTSTDQQKVVDKTEEGQKVVAIEPANPQVVYVPVYDPVWIWGPAPFYAPYPVWWYPPAPVFGAWCVWGGPIWLNTFYVGCCGWGGWGWSPHWHRHEVIVNNFFINRYNFEHGGDRFHGTGTTVWSHEPYHRVGVAYQNHDLSHRFRPEVGSFNRPVRPTAVQVQERFHEAAVRYQGRSTGDRFGSRQIDPSVYNHNRSAFGGIENGSVARVHSNRGYSSMNRARITIPSSNGGARWGSSGSRGGQSSSGGWGQHGGGGGRGEGGGWGGGGGHGDGGGGGGHMGGGGR